MYCGCGTPGNIAGWVVFGVLLAAFIGLFIGAIVASVDYNNCVSISDCDDKRTTLIALWCVFWIPLALAFIPFCYFCCCSVDPLNRAATNAAVGRIRSSNQEINYSPTQHLSQTSEKLAQGVPASNSGAQDAC